MQIWQKCVISVFLTQVNLKDEDTNLGIVNRDHIPYSSVQN